MGFTTIRPSTLVDAIRTHRDRKWERKRNERQKAQKQGQRRKDCLDWLEQPQKKDKLQKARERGREGKVGEERCRKRGREEGKESQSDLQYFRWLSDRCCPAV